MRFSRQSINSRITSLRSEAEIRDVSRRVRQEKISRFDNQVPISKKAINKVEERIARAARAAVVHEDEDIITVIAYTSKGPRIKNLIDELGKEGKTVNLFLASISKLEQAWGNYDSGGKKEETKRGRITGVVQLVEKDLEGFSNIERKIENITKGFEGLDPKTETREVMAKLLASALFLGASDIHVEPVSKEESLIRFRVDGILEDVATIPTKISGALTRRVKLLSKLKLNIREAPQDGRFTIRRDEEDIEVRASIVPAEFGEAIVLRVLDPRVIALNMNELGIREDALQIIETELKRPNGMIIVCGPTGSGKTTTLYAFLKKIKSPELKIVTIEDPIEYHLDGIQQTQINKSADYSFVTGIRSILRQDPDTLLIGEIRDKETADVAIQAALTGHLVFSTLHTNNAAGAIPRLIDLGAKSNVIAPALTLIIAQRLVRRLCEKCAEVTQVDDTMREKIDTFIRNLPKRVSRENMDMKLYKAIGCSECIDGYKGRIAIIEQLRVDDNIAELVKEKQTEGVIEREAIEKQEMVLLQQDGILKALNGVTTLEEIERETGPLSW